MLWSVWRTILLNWLCYTEMQGHTWRLRVVILKIYYKLSNKNFVQVLNDLLLLHIQILVTPENQDYICTTFLIRNDIRNNILKLRQQAENYLIQCHTLHAMNDNLLRSITSCNNKFNDLWAPYFDREYICSCSHQERIWEGGRGIASLILSLSTRWMQLIDTASWLL